MNNNFIKIRFLIDCFILNVNIRPYVKYLKEEGYSMMIKNKVVTASELFDDLISTINIVYNDVLGLGEIDSDLHQREYELFNNPHRVIDGPWYVYVGFVRIQGVCILDHTFLTYLIGFCPSRKHGYSYAFLIHGKGPAINGFGTKFPAAMNATSSNVIIRNNQIKDLKCLNREIPAAVENNTVVVDARGSVFQFINTITNTGIALNTTDGTYIRNVVADSQIMVAKAIKEGWFQKTIGNPLLETNLSTIPESMISWAEGIPTSSSPPKSPSYDPLYRCNGDSMHHVAKGIVVIRIEETYVYILKVEDEFSS
jgi:hypothetical protein